jgi:hypothetical protein
MAETLREDFRTFVTPLVVRAQEKCSVMWTVPVLLQAIVSPLKALSANKKDMEKTKEILSRSVHNINLLVFQCSNSYTFPASMAHHQGVHSCIKPHVQPFYQTVHLELAQVRQCMFIRMAMCTVTKVGLDKSKPVC